MEKENPNGKSKYIVKIEDHLNKAVHRLKNKQENYKNNYKYNKQ